MPEHDKKNTVICLMGPTASGKTETAIRLVECANCEIISVDSAQVYRHMDIGTAKPSVEELTKAPHHLIDIIDPDQPYSAAKFRHDALEKIEWIQSLGKTPLLVGGTFLYFRALLQGLAQLPESDDRIRAALDAKFEEKGQQVMYRQLKQIDPASAEKIHVNDRQRIQRALEVFAITNQQMSELIKQQTQQVLPFNVHKYALAPTDRSLLHRGIERRFSVMLEMGLVDEVRQLMSHWQLDSSMPSMRAVGYRQVVRFLQNKYTRPEMIDRAVIATRQLAKRQFTWLRSEKDTTVFDPHKQQSGDIAEQMSRRLKEN